MGTNETKRQMLQLTPSQMDLVRDGLALLEASLDRENAAQIDEIQRVLEEIGRPTSTLGQDQPLAPARRAARAAVRGGQST